MLLRGAAGAGAGAAVAARLLVVSGGHDRRAQHEWIVRVRGDLGRVLVHADAVFSVLLPTA